MGQFRQCICFDAKPVVSIVVLIICLAMQISSKTVKNCYKIKINYRESKSRFYGVLLRKQHPRLTIKPLLRSDSATIRV